MSGPDLLAEYNAKRDFKKTREPAGKVAKETGHRFIVQKHDATRLHYDFRLEVDGVLKSWAVTRGPSVDPEDKRLAVRTEDHPLSYATFEGSIPKGEYGGGTVMLWDQGEWAPVPGKSAKDIEDGHLHFTLDGKRMKGEWLLVRMKPRKGEKRENWLLRKIDDAYAGSGDELVARALTSVLTHRTMAEIAADAAGEQSLAGKKGAAFTQAMEAAADHNAKAAKPARKAPRKRATALPKFRPPQLATLVDAVPPGNNWLHEIKFDGYRCQVAVSGDTVRIYTRTGLDWTDRFQPLADAFAALDLPAALIDGEIVKLDADGNPGFSALQDAIKAGGAGLSCFVFDLLEADGEDLTKLSNIERKGRLEALIPPDLPDIHISDHVIGAGEKLFDAMCRAGQEGIISKRADAPYRGTRTRNWVKVKCTRRQEFIVIGWTKSSTRARPFASLLLAQHEGGALVYKGKVGTGFDDDRLDRLAAQMKPLARKTPPADVPKAEARGASWVKPDLVAEIAFAEFTADGRVRHASFLGLRDDKEAIDVTPENPAKTPSADDLVKISNRDRVIFPETGATKGDLADYIAVIAPLMLPFTAGRPISLVRCPQGRTEPCFFQKHDAGTFGDHVRHVPILEKDGGVEDYLYVEDAAGLLACVQMGTIEYHGWQSRVPDIELPDRMIMDLDPDEGLDFNDVKKAARDIRTTLADLGLVSFAMLSGGKGVHVVVPLTPGHEWDAHKDFARRFAEALSTREPARFVATMSKAKRKGRIFIDWLRNQRGATSVVPYSPRARENAPVAVPVAWDELDDFDSAAAFTIKDTKGLIDRAAGRALKGWGYADQPLPDF